MPRQPIREILEVAAIGQPGVAGQVEWLSGVVTYQDSSIVLGKLPANAIVVGQLICLDCRTAFTSDGNNRITIGYDSAEQAFLASSSALDVGTSGRKDVTPSHFGGSAGIFTTTARTLKAYYSYSGSAPGAGVARVALAYIRMPGAT